MNPDFEVTWCLRVQRNRYKLPEKLAFCRTAHPTKPVDLWMTREEPEVLPSTVQVQHEPTTINRVLAEGRGWTFELEDELHTRFTGTAVELAPIVLLQVAFSDGDTYRWGKVHARTTSPTSLKLLNTTRISALRDKSSCTSHP